MTRTELEITGMSCGHCVKSVQKALASLDGVQVEHVGIGTAALSYDEGKISQDAIAAAIEDEGYAIVGSR